MVLGRMDKGGSETGSRGAVTVGVQTAPYSQGTHCLPTAEGTPQEEPQSVAGLLEPIETPLPTAHHPESRVRIQAQESLRYSGFEFRWWILLSAASENQLLKVGPFPKDQTLSIFGSAGPSRLRGDRVPKRLVRKQAAAPELSTLTPLLGRRF